MLDIVVHINCILVQTSNVRLSEIKKDAPERLDCNRNELCKTNIFQSESDTMDVAALTFFPLSRIHNFRLGDQRTTSFSFMTFVL